MKAGLAVKTAHLKIYVEANRHLTHRENSSWDLKKCLPNRTGSLVGHLTSLSRWAVRHLHYLKSWQQHYKLLRHSGKPQRPRSHLFPLQENPWRAYESRAALTGLSNILIYVDLKKNKHEVAKTGVQPVLKYYYSTWLNVKYVPKHAALGTVSSEYWQ